jgi:hypothetical protein
VFVAQVLHYTDLPPYNSRTSSLPQSQPQDSEANTTPSSLARYVEENQQTSAETSRDGLQRYFSSPDRPTPIHDHISAEASEATHKSRAQDAIDAFDAIDAVDAVDAAMKEKEG